MNLPFVVARRLVQHHRNSSPSQRFLVRGVVQLYGLLVNHACSDAADPFAIANFPPMQRGSVLPRQEIRIAAMDAEEEMRRAKIAVVDPQFAATDHRHNIVQQRTLLGMAVLTGQYFGRQHRVRVQHHQGLARQSARAQRPQFLDPMLRPRQMIAIENADRITGQQSPNTTSLIRRVSVENNNSRVYCCSAVSSNKASILAGANDFSKTPRTITLTRLLATNRSNILLSNIRATSVKKLNSQFGKRQVTINPDAFDVTGAA